MRPWLWLILTPIAIHWPALSGWLSADPIYLESGLTRSWQSNGVLPGLPGWIDGNSGITLQALGRLVAGDWKAGIVPWWNPYSGVGLPLAGEMQPAAFFLPFVLLLGLTGGVLYLKIVLMIVAGLSMWGLLRQLGLLPVACFAGAVLFQLNGTFAWDSDSSSLPVAFLPLFLLGIERAWAAACANERGGWRVLCGALAYSLLSGFPETAFVDGLLALVWTALRFFQARGFRAGFSRRVALGAACGLMLCTPLLVAFFSFLGQTDMAMRALGHSALHRGDFAMFLFPYLYGPIFFGGLTDMWYRIGGYVGLPVVLLAVAAMFAAAGRAEVRERALRWMLAGWIVCCLAKAGGVPGITEIWNVIPGIAQSMFFRYAAASWECAAIVLAALFIDDLLAVEARTTRRAMVCTQAACLALCAAALVAGRPIWRDLGSVSGGRIWFLLALTWGFGCAGMAALAGIGRKPWVKAVVAVVLFDAAVQFSLPLLAGTRGAARKIDLGAVDFLKRNLGLNRFYTLGPIPPNYGAFYGLAELNHDYAPVPAGWVKYVRGRLDPLAPAVTFNGFTPPPKTGEESRPEAVRRRFREYAALGVKYVLARNWSNPFALHAVSLHETRDVLPLVLKPEQELSGSVASGEYDLGPIAGASLMVGTFGAKAGGALAIKLCAGSDCAIGITSLTGLHDNDTAIFKLDHTLSLRSGDILSFHIEYRGGATPVALWLFGAATQPHTQMAGPHSIPAHHMLSMALLRPETGAYPRVVFRSDLVDIYELPDPAAYFEAPGCSIATTSRLAVQLQCAQASRLLRRELGFPGWHATVNDKVVELDKAGIFQEIAVPSGDSRVRFSFAPPHVGSAYAAVLLGFALLAAPFWQGRKRVLF